jgi:surfeit locus 1 family protein
VSRLPVIPSLIVALAVAAMLALGVWQLDRRNEKAALIARYTANLGLPPMAYAELAPVPAESMFRKARVTCLRVVGWRIEGGRTAAGISGYRRIAECVTGAEGPGALVDMGVTMDASRTPLWSGGAVDGVITTEPQHTSFVGRLFVRAAPLRPMLVADRPAPGLSASAPPNPADVPNNHLAYAVQWFVFAGIAVLIYALALRRRQRADRA